MESDDTTHYERQPIASACPSGVMNTTVMHDGTPVVEREDFFFLYPFMTTMAMVVGVGGGRGWVVATGRRRWLRLRLKVLRELMYNYGEDRDERLNSLIANARWRSGAQKI